MAHKRKEDNSAAMWHRRLIHRQLDVILKLQKDQLATEIDIDGNTDCDSRCERKGDQAISSQEKWNIESHYS